MAEADQLFDYVAIDPNGRRMRGTVAARTNEGAFERLKRDGLSPVRIRAPKNAGVGKVRGLSERETADFLSELSALLAAGWDPLESTCRHASLSIL